MMIYSLHSWIAFGINFVCGAYVLKKDFKNPVNRLFSLFLLCLITWCLGWAMMLSETIREKSLFWARFAYLGPSLSPAIYLHLTLLFPVKRIYSMKNYPLMILIYLVGVTFLSLCFSSLLVEDVKWLDNFGIYTHEFGKLYPFYIGFYAICFCWGTLNLIRALKEAKSNRERLQGRYLICGIIIVFILSFISDISSFFFKLPLFILDSFFPLGVTIFWCAAIVSYRLMDIEIVIKKGLTYIFLIGLVIGLYVSMLEVFSRILQTLTNQFNSLVIVISTLIIAFLFYPLKNRIQMIIDKVFYRERVDYQKKLQEFTKMVSSTLEQKEISRSTLELVKISLEVKNSVLMLSDDKSDDFVIIEAKGLPSEILNEVRIRKDADFLNWAKRNCCKPVDIGQLSVDPQFRNFFIQNKEELKKLNTAVLIPLVVSDKLGGLFSIGDKTSNDIFTYRDFDFLSTLSEHLSVAIRNAQLYEEVKEVHRRLNHADKLAALGKLSAGIAHEIRNPLGIIKGSIQILENRLKDKEAEHKLVEFISTEVDRLNDILNEFLEFARAKEPDLKRANIDNIMDRILQLTSLTAAKQKVEVKKRFDEKLPEVIIDPEQIYQALLNIVMNSLQSMPDGGELEVNIGILNHDFVQVEIRDTGRGIPEEIIDKIFEPFFTTKDEGIGLGLTIANKIVTEHKGIILVDSKEGLGTTFRIRLPILRS